MAEAQRLGRDICIIDTAGRLTIDAEMMDQIKDISAATQPHYTFLVIDAMIGQDAVATAKAFHDALELSGVILTKLDGDARGGAALSVKGVVGRPIAFASTGERLADFDLFHPDRMADRILGMGDVLSLIEQAERTMDTDEVAKSASRLMAGQFTLEDFLSQLRQVKKMGSLGGLMRLMPGMNKEMREAAGQIDDGEVAKVEAIVCSMTPAERNDTSIMDGSRRSRVARGSGTTVQDVNALLKQFKEMQKMMKGMASGNMPNLPGHAEHVGDERPRRQEAGPTGGRTRWRRTRRRRRARRRGLRHAVPADGRRARRPTSPSSPRASPAWPHGAAPRPVVSVNKGTKKKKKGGRVTPPKGR